MTARATLALLVVAAALAGGCATTRAPAAADPFEPANRAMFAIHDPINEHVLRPAVEAYVRYVPAVARRTVGNFFANIEDFFSGVNGALQNKPDKAGHDFGRVLLNTGFGLGGLIDFATEAGIPRGNEDFGQTFGVWGFPQGPYLFIPLWGPTTVRDGTGTLVRLAASPVLHIEDTATEWALGVLGVVDQYAQTLEAQRLVDQASLDKYAFIRRSYLQRRDYLTYDGNPPPMKDEE